MNDNFNTRNESQFDGGEHNPNETCPADDARHLDPPPDRGSDQEAHDDAFEAGNSLSAGANVHSIEVKDQCQSRDQVPRLQTGQLQGSGVRIEGFSPKDLRALEHRELRRAAFHEAGHAALVRRYGGLAEPFVWPNDSGSIDEKAWRGTCQITVMPGKVKYPAAYAKLVGHMRTPKRWPLYVGLAGYVAEMIDRGLKNSEDLYFDFMMAYDASGMSSRRRT